MYAPDELRMLGRSLEPHSRVAILSDEIYEKLIFGADAHFSMGSMPSLAARTITINGLSKAYAMTGWRLGYLAAPLSVAQAIIRLQGQMTSHVTSFTGPAIVEALRRGGDSIEAMRRVFAKRAERVHAILSGAPGILCPRATGAFYVFPDIGATFGRRSPGGREIRSSSSFADALLEEASVAVVPGDEFGAGAERHVRLSFACADERIEAGYAALASFVRSIMAE